MKRVAMSILAISVLGCSLMRRDLVADGVYRLEVRSTPGCEMSASAFENGGLLVDGRLAGMRSRKPIQAEVVISLVAADGTELGKASAAVRLRPHVRRGHSHAYFEQNFDTLPPPGTLIKIDLHPLGEELDPCRTR